MQMKIQAGSTVAELVDAWLREPSLGDQGGVQLRNRGQLENSTINEYERVLRRLVLPALGTARLNDLTTEHIDALLAELSTRSVNRQRKGKVVTRAMLDPAVECGALFEPSARINEREPPPSSDQEAHGVRPRDSADSGSRLGEQEEVGAQRYRRYGGHH